MLAATALSAFEAVDSDAAAKRNVRAAVEQVAQRLGNTPTICRKCYVHPKLVETYLDRSLALKITRGGLAGLSAGEGAVLAFLHKGLGKRAKRPARRPSVKARTGRAVSAPAHRQKAQPAHSAPR